MPVTEDTIVRELWRHRVRLLAYIEVIVRDRDLAEDVFQEISIAALSKRDQINDADHLVRWLGQAARFHGLTAVRNRSNRRMVFDDRVLDQIEAIWSSDASTDLGPSSDALQTCLGRLTPYNRQLIELRYERGLTGVDLADAAGRKPNTVYVALARIHKQLAECVTSRLSAQSQQGAKR